MNKDPEDFEMTVKLEDGEYATLLAQLVEALQGKIVSIKTGDDIDLD